MDDCRTTSKNHDRDGDAKQKGEKPVEKDEMEAKEGFQEEVLAQFSLQEEYVQPEKGGVPVQGAGNALNRRKLVRSNVSSLNSSCHFWLLRMKFEPPSAFPSCIFYFND